MPSKTEFKGQPVETLRANLLDLFEDDEGGIASAGSKALKVFVDENWDYIDSQINKEPSDAQETEDPETVVEVSPQGDEANQEVEVEVLSGAPLVDDRQVDDPSLQQPNPKTDLYTGRLGAND